MRLLLFFYTENKSLDLRNLFLNSVSIDDICHIGGNIRSESEGSIAVIDNGILWKFLLIDDADFAIGTTNGEKINHKIEGGKE